MRPLCGGLPGGVDTQTHLVASPLGVKTWTVPDQVWCVPVLIEVVHAERYRNRVQQTLQSNGRF